MKVQVRFCPENSLTVDEDHDFIGGIPRIGETVHPHATDAPSFIVVSVDWMIPDETKPQAYRPFIIAHPPNRARDHWQVQAAELETWARSR